MTAKILFVSAASQPSRAGGGSGRRSRCQGEAVQDDVHVGSGRCLIVGLGDVEGVL